MTKADMEEALDAVLVPDRNGNHRLWIGSDGCYAAFCFSLLPGVCLDELLGLVRSGGWDDVDRFYIDHETMGGG